MSAKLIENLGKRIAEMQMERMTHEVREAKAKADQAEFIFEKVKEAAAKQQGDAEIMQLADMCACEKAGITRGVRGGDRCFGCPKKDQSS